MFLVPELRHFLAAHADVATVAHLTAESAGHVERRENALFASRHFHKWTATNTTGLNGNTVPGAGDVINRILERLSPFAIERSNKITFPLFNLRRIKVFDGEYKAEFFQETKISMEIIDLTIEMMMIIALIELRG